jgi:hypothetical protein
MPQPQSAVLSVLFGKLLLLFDPEGQTVSQ